MIEKISGLISAILVSLVFFTIPVLAQEDFSGADKSDKEIKIYFFSRNGCPHCTNEEPFLEKLEQKYPEVKVYKFDIVGDKEGLDLLKGFEKEFNIKVAGVPFTVVGEEHFTGWHNEETTGIKIENAILRITQNRQEEQEKEQEKEEKETVFSQNNFSAPNETGVVDSSLLLASILHRINSYIVLFFSL